MRKTSFVALMITCLLGIFLPLIASADCFYATDNSAQDTWIATGNEANTTHGDSTEIWVANHTDYISYGLLKFDLSQIPRGSVVKEVVIYMYADYVAGSDYLDLYQTTGAWDENTTYNTRPLWNGSKRIATTYFVEGNEQYGFASDDLTKLVQDWVDGKQSNFGLLMSARTTNNDNAIQFRSSENGLDYYPPKICIVYVPEKKLTVPYYSQYDTNWCAATSAAMLLKYYGRNRKLWDVVANDKLNWPKNVGLTVWWELLTSSFGTVFTDEGLTYERRGDVLPWLSAEQFISYVKSQLAIDRPVMVASGDWEHAIIITGFDTENGGHFYVSDPSGAYVNDILHLDVSFYVNVKIDYTTFLDSVSDPSYVLTYVITSPVPTNNPGVSISPFWTYEIKFFNHLSSPLDHLKFDLDAAKYPYGYYWHDFTGSYEDDEILGNKVSTGEDLRDITLSIANSNYETRSLLLSMDITNLDTNHKTTIINKYPIEVEANSKSLVGTDEWRYKALISESDIDLSKFIPGNYEMGFYLLNTNGTEVLDSFTLRFSLIRSKDVSAPWAPSSLRATPSSWTKDNSFNLSWDNPTDESGIQAVWYKIGSPPVNYSDGRRVQGIQVTNLTGISVPAEGTNNLYIWLEDGAGNKSKDNRSQVTLYYDCTPPVNGTITIDNGASETHSLIVNLDNLAAVDSLSGVSKMCFSNNSSGPWSPWEPYASGKTGWNLSGYGGNSGYGTKTVYVKYKDNAGNESGAFSDSINYTPSDTTPPPAPINLTVSPDGWTNVNSFVINWTNPSDPSGITAAWYKIGSMPNANNDGTRTTHKPFIVYADNEGVRNIYVWLEDGIGNLSYNNYSQVSLHYDHTPPANGTILINNGENETDSLVVNLNNLGAIDSLSGVSQMCFSNNSNGPWSPWESYASTKAGWDLSGYGGNSDYGTKTVYVKYKDNAGNESGVFSDAIDYTQEDTTPPPAPVNLTASPNSWTNVNSFNIDWTNPSDPSGIAAAWYKFGSPPSSPNDGTRTLQKPLTISSPGEGIVPVYVWLEDSAGNRSSNNYSSVDLYYDGTPPINGTIAINNGANETKSLVVSLNNLNATEAISAIQSMQFSNDGSTWSPEENFNTIREGWNLSLYGGNSDAGTKTVYVRYKDAAGNWSDVYSDTIEYVIPKVAYVTLDGDCGNNSPCFHSIQEAIDGVSEGAVVKVSEGIYRENIVIEGNKKVSIEGGWDSSFSERDPDPTSTVIDGDSKGSVIRIVADEGEEINVAIDSVTIRNGMAPNGAGVFAENAALKVSNSLIHSNHVSECIGAGLDLRGCRIELVKDEIFDNLNDQGGGAGIAISENCSGVIRYCSIHDNIIENFGCTQWDGGGILIHSSTIHLDGNMIYNNRAGYGGGIAIDFNQASLITNNIIWNNAANYGGGLFIAHDGSSPHVINNTICGNRAEYSGDGVEVWEGTAPVFINCIIWSNGENNYGGASVTYCDIEDGYSGEGNISEAPHFADPDGADDVFGSADDNFHLVFDSPCIDTGSNVTVNELDFEQDKRPTDGNMDGVKMCDMGADEFKLYEYWFPWASNEAWWPNNQQASTVDVITVEKNTRVFIDSNFNGMLDEGEIFLDVSSPSPDPKHLVTDLDPPIGYGVKVMSNKPISCWYERRNNNWGVYDDEMLMYSPPPLGRSFVVPFEGTVTCMATQDNTRITTPSGTYEMFAGECMSFDGHSGDQVQADIPIAVSIHSVDKSNMDNTLATGIYPVSYYGKEFYVVDKFKTNYPEQVDHRKLFIVYLDGGYEERDLPGTPSDHPMTSKIALEKKGFVYYRFDVEDGSSKHFTYAYPVPPAETLGTDYAYGGSIISTSDNNNIYFDSDYDGVFDKIISLNAGGTYNLPYRVFKNGYNSLVTRVNVGRIHSERPIFVFYIGIVSGSRDDACMGRIVSPTPPASVKLGRFADIDNDGDVDGMDLLSMVSGFSGGNCSIWTPCPSDLNADGKVDAHDLTVFAKQYGIASSSELEIMTSNVLSFSCFGDNCGHPESCCFNLGGEHCDPYNEGILTIPQIINPGNIARVEISLVNTNTQGSSDRLLDYFLSLDPDAQDTGLSLLSGHRVPGFFYLKQDPLVIDITDALMSLGLSKEYHFGVLNDDYWEVSVSDIMLKFYYIKP